MQPLSILSFEYADVFGFFRGFGETIKNILIWGITIIAVLAFVYFVVVPQYRKNKNAKREMAFMNYAAEKYQRFTRAELIAIRQLLQKYQSAGNKQQFYQKKVTKDNPYEEDNCTREEAMNLLTASLAQSLIQEEAYKELQQKYSIAIDDCNLEIRYLDSIL